ncbi:MAG: hypothetical protein PHF56_18150 [Desulfuromonadaceae bacterium]|nr:hypothetical protein [Desulfuromonadaceae bacterium]
MKRVEKIAGAGLTVGLVVVLLGGCAGTAAVTQSAVTPVATTEAAVPQKTEKAVVVPEETFLSGKVVETMRATGYTYIQLENDGKKAWFAVPSVAVSVGQDVEVRPGMQMGLFNSKSLNRKFDSIVFSPGLVEDPNAPVPAPDPAPPAAPEQSVMPSGHPSLDADPKAFAGKATKEQLRKAGVIAVSGKIVETMNSGGYTYLLIASGDKNVWGAVPTTAVSVGQEVELLPGQTMTNFTSKSLNKTFESVIFSTGVVPVTK